MPKVRSPNYPAVGLGEAVVLIEKIWDKAHRTRMADEAAIAAMGYHVHGKSRTLLSALKKYGLLEEEADGSYVSDQAMCILLPGSDDEKLSALQQAARKPELFAELAVSHARTSDTVLRSHLLRQGFSKRGAEQAAAAFRETVKIARLDSDAPSPPKRNTEIAAVSTDQSTDAVSEPLIDSASRARVWDLPGDRRVEVRVSDGAITKSDIEILRKYLDVLELTAPDEAAMLRRGDQPAVAGSLTGRDEPAD